MDAPPSVQLPAHPDKGPTKGPLAVTIVVVFALVAFTVHLVGPRGYLFCAGYSWATAWMMFSFGTVARRILVRYRPQWLDPPWKRSCCMLLPMLAFAAFINLLDRYAFAGFYLRNGWLTPENLDRFMDASLLVRLAAVLAVNGYFSARLSYVRMTASLELQAEALRHAGEARKQQIEAEAQRQRAEIEARMAKQLAAEAELNALKMQINPHFLFNTLNAVSELMYDRPAVADEMLSRIGSLLRATLSAGAQEHRLADEWKLLALYMDIQRARFGAGLDADVQGDAALDDLRIPFLLLQPLVENAIEHGGQGDRRLVRVEAGRDANRLTVKVRDGGGGVARAGHGIGLGNVEARLRHLYGDEAGVRLEPLPEGGSVVTVWLPARRWEAA